MARAKSKISGMRRVINSDLDPFAEAIEATADDVEELYQSMQEVKKRFEELNKYLRYDDKKVEIVSGESTVVLQRDSILIKTGVASIQLKKDGAIFIKGDDISIVGAGRISVKASGDVTVKGSKIAEN